MVASNGHFVIQAPVRRCHETSNGIFFLEATIGSSMEASSGRYLTEAPTGPFFGSVQWALHSQSAHWTLHGGVQWALSGWSGQWKCHDQKLNISSDSSTQMGDVPVVITHCLLEALLEAVGSSLEKAFCSARLVNIFTRSGQV